MSDLKPCPFCGKEPNQATVELSDRPCFYYECENPKCHAKPETGWHDTEQEARDAWNNRPVEDALQARIDNLDKALDKAAHKLYDYSGSCPSDLYDWEHPNICIRECDRYDNPDEAWKCWRLWLLEKPKEEE